MNEVPRIPETQEICLIFAGWGEVIKGENSLEWPRR